METTDFFRCRIDAMINLRHPLAVLATRLPWAVIEASLAPKFERKDRPGQLVQGQDMLGPTTALVGAGRSNAGRPRTPIRLMASLLYLKHTFDLSDEDVCERWSESPLWQFFSGQDYYEHRLPCDATQVGRFLSQRMMKCGKPNCRCANDPAARHGPYYEWGRMRAGKLVHRYVTTSPKDSCACPTGWSGAAWASGAPALPPPAPARSSTPRCAHRPWPRRRA